MDYDVLFRKLTELSLEIFKLAGAVAKYMYIEDQAQAEAVANAHDNIILFPGIKINSEAEK